jgi:hypothetical protein
MTNEQILQANHDIAVFMGFKEQDIQAEEWCESNVKEVDFFGQNAWMPYNCHKQWYRLMPVVEKICSEKFEDGENVYLRTFGMINPENGYYMVRLNRHTLFEAETLIYATFLAVVDYIKNK